MLARMRGEAVDGEVTDGEAVDGEARRLVGKVCLTVTLMVLAAVRPVASRRVTVKVYWPAVVKVAVVVLAAFVPLAVKVGDAAPVGSQVAAQV